jgi:hypothetical protein
MHGLDVFRMVISAGPAHSLRVSVVRHNFAAVGKFMVANGTLPVLLDDLPVQQLPHLCRWPEFAESPGVVRIFDAPNTQLKSVLFSRLLATAAEQRAVDRTIFIPTEFHGNAPVWFGLISIRRTAAGTVTGGTVFRTAIESLVAELDISLRWVAGRSG